VLISLREVVGHQNNCIVPAIYRFFNPILEHDTKERPSKVKSTTDVSEGLNDTKRNVRHHRKMEPTVHTLERGYFCRVFRAILSAPQNGIRVAVFFALFFVVLKKESHKCRIFHMGESIFSEKKKCHLSGTPVRLEIC
jgi:hypothetical protein